MTVSAKDRYFGFHSQDLRRVQKERKKVFEVTKMWDIHHEIARLLSLGMKVNEIASTLGVTPAMVSYTKNSRVVEDKIGMLRAKRDSETIDLGQRIQGFLPTCLDLLEDVIKGKHKDASINLRTKTAQDYADRGGLGAVKKHQVMSAHLTREDIEALKQRARDARIISSPNIIEAEVVQ